jgi:hypothetical protein
VVEFVRAFGRFRIGTLGGTLDNTSRSENRACRNGQCGTKQAERFRLAGRENAKNKGWTNRASCRFCDPKVDFRVSPNVAVFRSPYGYLVSAT